MRPRKVRNREGAIASTRGACAPQIIVFTLCLTLNAGAATLQQRIDLAAAGETIRVVAGVHAGPIIIKKPVTLIGEPDAEIRGNGSGKVVTIAANDVTLRGLRITGSGLQLFDDDAAVFVIGNAAKIENCSIADSLHGVYLKKVSGAQILNNRIQGKTTLAASTEPVEQGIGQSAENCDTTLVANRRGNGIHQWNCEGNLIRDNEISDARDGIYFSFTNNSRVENNLIHHVRYGLHYMYSDANTFENNTFTENAAGAAIMFSKNIPLPRAACVVGKFCALLSMFGGVLLLMFVPGLLAGLAIHAAALLYFETFLLAATFLTCGLAAGYLAHDRAQGLIVGVSVWLLLLFGLDLVALFAARWSAIQTVPDLWVALLMFNPLDSFRINALFALQQIPAEAANKTPLASWWIAHASVWFIAITVAWSAVLIMLSGLRLKRWEE